MWSRRIESITALVYFDDMNPFIHTRDDTLAASGDEASHALKFAKLAAAFMAELAGGRVQ